MTQTDFTVLYQKFSPKIFRLCKGYFAGDLDTANDITQEVFMKVWQQHDTFRNEANISTWIYQIAVNSCLLYLRKASNRKEFKTESLPEIPDSNEDHLNDDKLQQLYGCIAKLDEPNRLIIMMVLDGLSYEEIAKVVGVSEDTLRVKIHRIKKNLTQCVTK
ncbi:MAG: sigma-70 family RNA polymerase sigma factor [Arcicella sp.]|jgi:RNA polymerase sigma factor (sigma-70 family)|nr:sigma-70 family RNA polymerase sigma factor [Arcicella sp.]